MAEKIPMTVNGAEQLRKELHHLKTVERPAIIQAIFEARKHGDLKENAEYHAAKERQSFIEGRIQDLEAKLYQAQIIDISKIPNQGKVIFGTTVELLNVENDKTISWQIVGDDEADIKANKISVHSPIARGIIGKKVGDVVVIQTPSGAVEYEIKEVRYT